MIQETQSPNKGGGGRPLQMRDGYQVNIDKKNSRDSPRLALKNKCEQRNQ